MSVLFLVDGFSHILIDAIIFQAVEKRCLFHFPYFPFVFADGIQLLYYFYAIFLDGILLALDGANVFFLDGVLLFHFCNNSVPFLNSHLLFCHSLLLGFLGCFLIEGFLFGSSSALALFIFWEVSPPVTTLQSPFLADLLIVLVVQFRHLYAALRLGAAEILCEADRSDSATNCRAVFFFLFF